VVQKPEGGPKAQPPKTADLFTLYPTGPYALTTQATP
jgi:hypothetical protein